MAQTKERVEFGDWQTPLELAAQSLKQVTDSASPSTIVEPTCGKGAFLLAAHDLFPSCKLLGFEVNPEYVQECRNALKDKGALAEILHADFFQQDWRKLASSWPEPILVVGNPPWVTSSALGGLTSSNLPAKENLTRLSGMDARTGKSNFDVSEWMILRMLQALEGKNFTLCMLCKSAVARKVLLHAASATWSLHGEVRAIDATRHFQASVDAVLLVIRATESRISENLVWPIYETIDSPEPVRAMGVVDGVLSNDLKRFEATRGYAGTSNPAWRSGVKHDCSKVMELSQDNGKLVNGLGEVLEIEKDLVFPLLKGSDVANGRQPGKRFVIATQRKIGGDTRVIAATLPKTWSYLESHRDQLDARKSSIYKGQPPFSIFGVGDYTFAPFKVAVCGLYKRLTFMLVEPHEGKPVLFDDTVYFLPFDTLNEAKSAAEVLNGETARDFFEARVFWDAKRPISKAVLQSFAIQRLFRADSPRPENLAFQF